ncbi:DUF4339 domain-containing protein [Aeromicrobium sp. Leaf350]|uniref:DUF4339 domain-containing protein n=1 Tax=Aeromicrobium sp. Leaf350 TaxID=2876565 RepID=UPI001E6237EB|nr:DUF4339 domain-containing protein [Aeromicrobium sp. Leaf350]
MSTTAPPPAASAPATEVETPETPTRRFGVARALGLAVAAFLGGYLAHLALAETIDVFRDRLFSQYNSLGSADERFRLLSLLAEGFGALAGVVAVIGLAARRWAVGVLVLTLVSALCHVGFAAQVIDTNFRPVFLEPGRNWGASYGLPFTVAVLALQLLVVLLCLVRGPRPEPVVVAAPPVAAEPPPPAVDRDDDRMGEDRMHTPDDQPRHASPVAVADHDEADDDVEPDDDVYLVIHGREYGPYPADRVRGFMVEGRIHPGTLVRIGDETKPASEVPAIFGG